MGTIVNVGAILAGSMVGLVAKRFLKPELEQGVKKALALCVLLIGVFGVFTSMATVTDEGRIETDGMILLIISLVVGVIIGTLLKLDERLNRIGNKLEKRFGISQFSESFITATLLFCVGAMTIVGSINDGLLGDPSLLYVKALLDGISSVILVSSLGMGAAFSTIVVLVYQGALTLLASLVGPLLSDALLSNLSMVGYALVACLGFNLMELMEYKTVDLLPSLLVPILYGLIF